jgi:hypothetical protein
MVSIEKNLNTITPSNKTVYVRMYLDENTDIFHRNHPMKYTAINKSKQDILTFV